MNIVLDANALISAAYSPGRNASNILNATFMGVFRICYDYRILEEYYRVFNYLKFKFTKQEINAILTPLTKNGISVIADPIKDILFEKDESDRKFYEVAKYANAILITGNLKHYPKDDNIMNASEFCDKYL